jgi:hypothetical protein
MRRDTRLSKLRESMRDELPDPEAEERKRESARQFAILEEIEALIHEWNLPGPLKDFPGEWDRVVEAAVPRGLLNHGLSGAEVEEMVPEYIEMFSEERIDHG